MTAPSRPRLTQGAVVVRGPGSPPPLPRSHSSWLRPPSRLSSPRTLCAALAAQHLAALGQDMAAAEAADEAPDCRASVQRCLVCLGDLARCVAVQPVWHAAVPFSVPLPRLPAFAAQCSGSRRFPLWPLPPSRFWCKRCVCPAFWSFRAFRCPPPRRLPCHECARAAGTAWRRRRRRSATGRAAATFTCWRRGRIPRVRGVGGLRMSGAMGWVVGWLWGRLARGLACHVGPCLLRQVFTCVCSCVGVWMGGGWWLLCECVF